MSSVERRFFSAANLDRAVLEAAGHFGVDPSRLRYEQVDKRSGFTKRRRVVIRVDPTRLVAEPGELPVSSEPPEREAEVTEAAEAVDVTSSEVVTASSEGVSPVEAVEGAPAEAVEEASEERVVAPETYPARREPAAPQRSQGSIGDGGGRLWRTLPRTVEESLEAQPLASSGAEASARQWLELLLGLADLDLGASVRMGPERLDVNLSGADAEWLVEDEGEALQALQTLLPRLLDGDTEESMDCRVDCNGFQELREERLRARAHRAAAEVRRTGERAILEPMMPADRRVVHVALLHDASVTTESLGRGYFKRVTIRSA
ncbi:MAG TPA: R3H domain-containing nucleic acid-binding protein [Thermoanaerobaculia bacterium]|nr:R3H domain-containing nucleic acid-binding protein [Thermoanaerobaculia bacterium]